MCQQPAMYQTLEEAGNVSTEEERKQKEALAATKIQTANRGKQARRQVEQKRVANRQKDEETEREKLKAAEEQKKKDDEEQKQREAIAATKIQSASRSKNARAQVEQKRAETQQQKKEAHNLQETLKL